MNRIVIMLAAILVATLALPQESQAQRRFLFPNLAANRLNAQANANLALANLRASQQVVAAAKFGAPVVVKQQFAFAAPHYRVQAAFAVPQYRVQAFAPQYSYAQVAAAPVYYAPPVFQAPVLAAPSCHYGGGGGFQSVQSFSAVSAGGYCGF